MEVHEIAAVYNKDSKILILGSFPSVMSREGNFFYHHPQNRFWKVVAYICEQEEPKTIEEKKQLLLRNQIALWDVIHSCTITGSSDQSIENVVVNDIMPLINQSKIKYIFTNGTLATKLYHKHMEKITNIKATSLPSTSSANARYSLDKLKQTWKQRIEENQ